MGASVTPEQSEILASLLRQYDELSGVVESVKAKASQFDEAELKGLAFAAHMVSESLSAYAKELGKYIKKMRRL